LYLLPIIVKFYLIDRNCLPANTRQQRQKMAGTTASNGIGAQQPSLEKSPFEKQRDILIGQITQVWTLFL